MKDFDLYKTLCLWAAIGIILALLFQLDYSGVDSYWADLPVWLYTPFQWTNGWFAVVLIYICANGNK